MKIDDIVSFLSYFDGIRHRTLRVARLIPPHQIEWRPAPNRWSFGDLLRHLAAAERWMFTENVLGRPSRYPGHGPALAEGHEAVLAYLGQMHEQSNELLRPMTPDDLTRRVHTPAGSEITAWKWLRAMVEHEAHHRGQIYLHLTTLGVATPPLFGLTEEEVRERS